MKEKYLHSRSSISTFEENSLKETFSIAASNVQKYSFWKTNFVKKSGKFTIKLGELFEEVEGGGGGLIKIKIAKIFIEFKKMLKFFRAINYLDVMNK